MFSKITKLGIINTKFYIKSIYILKNTHLIRKYFIINLSN